MSRRRTIGTFWPSAQQELLLAVALQDPSAGRATLPTELSLDELEPGSYELLPLVYRNLARSETTHPLLPRLKGVYRKTWAVNGLLSERVRATADVLREKEIPALFVEGVALAERFYPESGLRPTSAIDVLVNERDQRRALACLARGGWSNRVPTSSAGAPQYLYDAAGTVCVLRTTLATDLVRRSSGRPAVADLWQAAGREVVGGADVLVPSATETLLAVCVLHVRASSAPNVQWIADAKMLLAAEIDWERLLASGIDAGQAPRLAAAFRYLTALPGATPPASVLERLDRRRSSPRERLTYVLTSGAVRGAGSLPVLAAEHLAATSGQSTVRTIATFPRHLRERWNLASSWRVPLSAASRALRLVSARVRGSA